MLLFLTTQKTMFFEFENNANKTKSVNLCINNNILGVDFESIPKPKEYPPLTFELYHSRRRCYFITASTKEEFDDWVAQFRTCCWHARGLTMEDEAHQISFSTYFFSLLRFLSFFFFPFLCLSFLFFFLSIFSSTQLREHSPLQQERHDGNLEDGDGTPTMVLRSKCSPRWSLTSWITISWVVLTPSFRFVRFIRILECKLILTFYTRVPGL